MCFFKNYIFIFYISLIHNNNTAIREDPNSLSYFRNQIFSTWKNKKLETLASKQPIKEGLSYPLIQLAQCHQKTRSSPFSTTSTLRCRKGWRKLEERLAMAASLQAATTLMQPAKLGSSGRSTVQLRSSQGICRAFGVEQGSAKLTCSLQTYFFKDLAQKCVDAAKVAGFALATSALVVSV